MSLIQEAGRFLLGCSAAVLGSVLLTGLQLPVRLRRSWLALQVTQLSSVKLSSDNCSFQFQFFCRWQLQFPQQSPTCQPNRG